MLINCIFIYNLCIEHRALTKPQGRFAPTPEHRHLMQNSHLHINNEKIISGFYTICLCTAYPPILKKPAT